MKSIHIHYPVIIFALLAAMIACVVPGQAVPPAPVSNPINIETAVAGTSQAAAQLTQQAAPATATLAPAATSTSTPKIGASGTSLVVREDQSTLFIDYRAGIQLVTPPGWVAYRVNEEEYLKVFTLDAVLQNPEIQDRLTTVRDNDPNHFRLEAIDMRPRHTSDGTITLIDVDFEPGDLRSLEEWERAERDRPHPFDGFKFLSATYPRLSNGTQVLVLEESWTAASGTGTTYYKSVFFRLPTGAVVLDFFVHSSLKDIVLPEFDQVVNSVTALNPR